MAKKISVLSLLICLTSVISYTGEHYELVGWIKYENRSPANGVVVSIGGYNVITKQDGYYNISFLKAGKHVVSITPPGNPTRSFRITIKENKPYQLDANSEIWKITGPEPTRRQLLDCNSETIAIASDESNLYKMHEDGRIWEYTGPPMTEWKLLDANIETRAIVAYEEKLYKMHEDGRIWEYTGSLMTDWEPLNYDLKAIAFFTSGKKVRKDFIINR